MNKIIKSISAILIVSSLFMFSGCDELTNLPVNVPIVINFSTSGSNTTLTEESGVFCLSDYQEWKDNQDGVNGASFISAAYWTENATPGLQGDVTVTLLDQFGNPLFAVTLEDVQAADNIDAPFALSLNETQIQAFDNYLALISENGNDQCFNARLTISNISADSTPYQLDGRVEIVIEADVDL